MLRFKFSTPFFYKDHLENHPLKTPFKRTGSGLGVTSQKAIMYHYAKIDKAEVVAEFSSDEYEKYDAALDDAISFCLKNACTLIVVTLDSLPGNINHVFAIKKSWMAI